MNIVVVGPSGVGKSTVSNLFAQQAGMRYLDFDKIRSTKNSLPCSLSRLNILECLSSELDSNSTGFVLDIGGGTVFRPNIDNDDRLRQILQLKNAYSAQVVMLTANQDILFERYINTKTKDASSKQQNSIYFNNLWSDWLTIEQPYWQLCVELTIDTTSLTAENTIEKIEEWHKN